MSTSNETTTKFRVDISELKKAMQDAKRQVAVANSEFKAVSSTLDNWGKSTEGVKAKLKQLDSNLKSQTTILASLEKQYELTVSEMGEGSKAADDLKIKINNQKAVVNNVQKEINTYSNRLTELEDAQEEAARTGRTLDEVLEDTGDTAEETSGGFTVMKGTLASLVADGIRLAIDALKDLAQQTITTGMDFEKSMDEVAAISGASGKDLELLEKTAKEFGATTTFSASEAAQALKYMALAGWDANTASSALGGVLDLAAASGMDLAQASDMVTDYLSAFGMEAQQSTYFADMLAYAQSNSNTSAEQLGEAYKNSAASMKAAGQDVETTTALLAMMANQGFKGSEAGTALTAMMRDLTAKMKDGKVMIGDTAVTVMDANGNYRDMTSILKDVEAATNGMGDAERSAALSTTFTADSTKGLNLLLNAGVGSAEEFEEALRGAGGTAGEMGDIMNDNAQGDIKQMQSALEDVMLVIYEELQPYIRQFIQDITTKVIPNVKSLIQHVKDFIQGVKDAEPVIAGLAAALTGLALTALIGNFTKIIALFKSWTVVTKLQTAATVALNIAQKMNIIGIVISLLVGLVAAFVVLWKKSDAFRSFWIKLWEIIKTTFMTVANSIKDFFTVKIPSYINKAIGFFKNFPKNIGYILGFALAKFFQWGVNLINFAKTKIPEFISKVVTFVSKLPSKIWTWLVATVGKLNQWVSNMKSKGKEAANGLINSVVSGAKSIPSKMLSIGKDIVNGVWKGIKNAKANFTKNVKSFFSGIVDGAKDALKIKSPSRVFANEVGKFIPSGIALGINANADSALKSIKSLTSDMVATANVGLSKGADGGSAVSGGVVNNYTQVINSPKQLNRLDIYRQSKNLLGYVGGRY